LPHGALVPVAVGAELAARITGRQPLITRDAVRMSRKRMYFSSEKASRELGYRPRPARDGIVDAVTWFRVNGYLK
jgi:dihydroflavonol-4-reductase